MTRALLLLLAAGLAGLLAPLAPGVADGRAGVAALDAGNPVGAVAAFQAGLAADAPRWARARLLYDLGVALDRAGNAARADTVLGLAVPLHDDPAARARAAWAAGTAALAAGDAPRAVGLLRRALLLAPDVRLYRRTYEIARRRADGQDPPEPSDFARRLKARADSLVAARQYAGALALMQDGLERDATVAAFADWTARLSGVVEMERATPDTTAVGAPPARGTSPDAPAVPRPR